MKISLIISTYNSPERLRVVLDSVMRQSRLPDEIIIADDGSDDATRAVVELYAGQSPRPVVHVWHPDEGFRLAMIRNKAIARASGDFIIQIDGDILLHRRFVEDHERRARRGWFGCGKRVQLGPAITERILRSEIVTPSLFSADLHNRKNALRSPLLGKFFRCIGGKRVHHRGCNMAYWRDDALAVNGFDEAFEGWGFEDTDFFNRLRKLGRKPLQIANEAVAFHLWHPSNEADNPSVTKNREILRQASQRSGYRAENGIDKYIRSAENESSYSS